MNRKGTEILRITLLTIFLFCVSTTFVVAAGNAENKATIVYEGEQVEIEEGYYSFRPSQTGFYEVYSVCDEYFDSALYTIYDSNNNVVRNGEFGQQAGAAHVFLKKGTQYYIHVSDMLTEVSWYYGVFQIDNLTDSNGIVSEGEEVSIYDTKKLVFTPDYSMSYVFKFNNSSNSKIVAYLVDSSTDNVMKTFDGNNLEYTANLQNGRRYYVYVDTRGGVEFKVEQSKLDLSNADVSLTSEKFYYTGEEIKPDLNVTCNGKILMRGTDYAVSYFQNIYPGQGTIKITGKGIYTGTIEKSFTVLNASISSADITLDKTQYTYDGSYCMPGVTLEYNGKKLKENTDYRVSYDNNINAGTATVTIVGIDCYSGTIVKEFTINKASQDIKVSTSTKTVKKSTVRNKSTLCSFRFSDVKGNLICSSLTTAIKKGINKVEISGDFVNVTVKKGAPAGIYKLYVKAEGNSNCYESEKIGIVIKVQNDDYSVIRFDKDKGKTYKKGALKFVHYKGSDVIYCENTESGFTWSLYPDEVYSNGACFYLAINPFSAIYVECINSNNNEYQLRKAYLTGDNEGQYSYKTLTGPVSKIFLHDNKLYFCINYTGKVYRYDPFSNTLKSVSNGRIILNQNDEYLITRSINIDPDQCYGKITINKITSSGISVVKSISAGSFSGITVYDGKTYYGKKSGKYNLNIMKCNPNGKNAKCIATIDTSSIAAAGGVCISKITKKYCTVIVGWQSVGVKRYKYTYSTKKFVKIA